jgi:Cu/Ag efflux pump CusA
MEEKSQQMVRRSVTAREIFTAVVVMAGLLPIFWFHHAGVK